jgi:hypothetical protein
MLQRTIIFSLLLVSFIFAQDAELEKMNLNDYLALAKEDLAVQSKKLMLVNMQLSEQEGEKYWPIYDAYFGERSKIMDERVEMYKMIADKYGSMTDDDAAEVAKTFFALEDKLSKLERETFNKISEELSSLRGIQFLQIQRQIDTILKLQVSGQFPLLK